MAAGAREGFVIKGRLVCVGGLLPAGGLPDSVLTRSPSCFGGKGACHSQI